MSDVKTYLSEFESQINQLKGVIDAYESFLIIGHNHPDGDCIGSLLGFGKWLEHQDKKVHYVVPSAWDDYFAWVPHINTIVPIVANKKFKKLPKTQVTVFLDFSSIAMISDASDVLLSHPSDITVCIDHHLSPDAKVDIMIDDTNSSSCCELLREIMNHIDPSHLDKDIASYCYMGLVTDTGWPLSNGLEYEKDTIRSLGNMTSMVSYWVDKSYILQQLGKISLHRLQFASQILTRVKWYGKVLWTWYHDDEAKSPDDTGSWLALDIMRKVDGYPITIKFCIHDTYVSCSLRAVQPYDVQAIAKSFGWWWHILASAFRLQWSDYTASHLGELVKKVNELATWWA